MQLKKTTTKVITKYKDRETPALSEGKEKSAPLTTSHVFSSFV